jgi:hypothetical protein
MTPPDRDALLDAMLDSVYRALTAAVSLRDSLDPTAWDRVSLGAAIRALETAAMEGDAIHRRRGGGPWVDSSRRGAPGGEGPEKA